MSENFANARIMLYERNTQDELPTIEELSEIRCGDILKFHCQGEYISAMVESFEQKDNRTFIHCTVLHATIKQSEHGITLNSKVILQYHNIYKIIHGNI